MTGALLDLAELAVRAEVPVERVRHYAEVGLLPPARRDGDRLGYPPGEASTARMLAGAEGLGLDTACGRSKVAAAAFARLGYRDVRVYDGGKADWAAAGLPFEGSRTAAGVMR